MTIRFSVPVYAYMAENDGPRLVEVTAHQVGRLAIHRAIHWFRGQEPKASDKYWTVSHIASGAAVNNALPQELRQRPRVPLRDLKSWAERWQENPAVTRLLDAADQAVEREGRYARPSVDDATVYAAREAGWRL